MQTGEIVDRIDPKIAKVKFTSINEKTIKGGSQVAITNNVPSAKCSELEIAQISDSLLCADFRGEDSLTFGYSPTEK